MVNNLEVELKSKEKSLGIISAIADYMVFKTEDPKVKKAFRLIISIARQGHGVVSVEDEKQYGL